MSEFKSDSSLKRVMSNGVFSAIQFVAYGLSGIILTPFLLNEFGLELYGLIALAGFLTQYIGMISNCVGGSVSRFLNIALNQNDWDGAGEIFSTALVGNLVVVILQIPIYALGIWKLNWLIDFPENMGFDFRILVSCNVLMFFISILVGVVGTPIHAANRLDLGMKIGVVQQAIRLVLLFGLISWAGAKLWIIGVVDLSLSVVGAATTYFFYKMVAARLVFSWRLVTPKWFKPIISMAGFMMISLLANCLFFKTDVWMLNRFVDAKIAGIYAALLVWPNFLTQVASRLAGLVGPTYFIDYARGDLKRVLGSVLFTEKLISFFAIFSASFFVFFSERVLSVWIRREPTQFEGRLLILFFVTASFSVCSEAIWRIFQVFNRPKVPGIVALLCGVLNIVLSLTLIYFGAGAYGVVAGTMISSLVLKAFFQPWYAARLLNQRPRDLWLPIAISLAMCFLAIAVKDVLSVLHIDFWYVYMGYVAASSAVAFFVLFSRDEVAQIASLLSRFSSRWSRQGSTSDSK